MDLILSKSGLQSTSRFLKIFSSDQSHHLNLISNQLIHHQISFYNLHGLPPAIWYGGTSFVTTELAAIIEPSPICTPGITVTFCPIHTSLSTQYHLLGANLQEWALLFPSLPHDIKRISCYRFHSMICTIHNKFYSFCYCTKLTYNKFVTYKFIMMSNMFFKLFCSIYIIIISVISNLNIRIFITFLYNKYYLYFR